MKRSRLHQTPTALRGSVVGGCVPHFKTAEIAAEKAFLCGEPFFFLQSFPLLSTKPITLAPCPCGENTKPRLAPRGERYREKRRVARTTGRARRSGAVKPPPHEHGASQGAPASEASFFLLMNQMVR